jgi:hypothetical protein
VGSLWCDWQARPMNLWMPRPIGHIWNFVAHGMGLVSHEAPRMTRYEPWAYDG